MSGSNDDTTEATKQEAMRQARLLGPDERPPELTKVRATLEAMFPGHSHQAIDPISFMANWLIQDGLPDWLVHFLMDNADYGDQHVTTGLGERAEFVGLWRKMGKLKSGLWEGKALNGEGVDEMLDDLIASAFLIKHLRAIDRGETTRPTA